MKKIDLNLFFPFVWDFLENAKHIKSKHADRWICKKFVIVSRWYLWYSKCFSPLKSSTYFISNLPIKWKPKSNSLDDISLVPFILNTSTYCLIQLNDGDFIIIILMLRNCMITWFDIFNLVPSIVKKIFKNPLSNDMKNKQFTYVPGKICRNDSLDMHR